MRSSIFEKTVYSYFSSQHNLFLIANSEFLIGSKLSKGAAPSGVDTLSMVRERLIAGLSLRLLAGSSSPFFTRLYAEGTLTRDFDFEADYTADTATMIIGGQSPDPEKVFQELLAEANSIREKGFSKAYFPAQGNP